MTLLELADAIGTAPREGADRDVPEGARYVRISDTLLAEIEERLRNIAAAIEEDGCV